MPQSYWLDDEQFIQDAMFEGVAKHVQELFDQVGALDVGFALLHFLDANANSFKTADDIAYHLKHPQATVEPSLRALVELGLASQVDAAGMAFFGLTADLERRQLLHELCAWQDHWYARLARVERVLRGKARHRHSQRNSQPDIQVSMGYVRPVNGSCTF
jgi:hypothetical protein